MDELISRAAVLDALRARFGVDFDYGKWWSSTHVMAAIESVPGVTCDDAISRTQAIEAVKAIKFGLWEIDIPSPSVPEYREHHEQVTELMGVCDCWIKKLTEYESVQPKVGHWIYTGDYITDGMLKCSECGFEHDVSEMFSYCPNCSAKMIEPPERGEKE